MITIIKVLINSRMKLNTSVANNIITMTFILDNNEYHYCKDTAIINIINNYYTNEVNLSNRDNFNNLHTYLR